MYIDISGGGVAASLWSSVCMVSGSAPVILRLLLGWVFKPHQCHLLFSQGEELYPCCLVIIKLR